MPERYRAPQDGKTPLFIAVREGRVELVEQLLAAGATVDAKDEVVGGGARIGKVLRGNTQLLL